MQVSENTFEMENSAEVWVVPEPISIHEAVMEDGSRIILRRHGNPNGQRLVLCHGNGLAIDFYYPFWSLLTNDFDLIVYDLRNHGWNSVTAQINHNLPTFVSDHNKILEEIDKHFGNKPKIGVYHSVSALVALLSPTNGREYEARILFDPPVCKSEDYPIEYDIVTRRVSRLARCRVEWIRSMEEYVEVLEFLPAFKLMVPGTLDLFPRTTFRKCPGDEGYQLCCPRDYEAQIIYHARSFSVIVDFDNFQCPTKAIGADPLLPFSYLPSFDLNNILNVDYDFIPETTHFLQLEQPEKCVRTMLNFLKINNLLKA
ncbi:MAG: alpha/beta hydrolase [Rhodobacteraceae bacterium]|nr:alpha/beta hydrolase [Paracoccaceae bacterium]